MCGRYTLTVTLEELITRYEMDGGSAPYHQPRYNVSPGQMIPAVISDGSKNRMGELKWGLTPAWAKEEKMKMSTINARSETLSEKPTYRIPFQRKRCIVPADSFYEWKKVEGKKQPMRIMLKSEEIFSMAALYDTWIREDGTKLNSCSIITTVANELMFDIHERMPVILAVEDEALWLDRNIQNIEKLSILLKPYPTEEMKVFFVTSPLSPDNV